MTGYELKPCPFCGGEVRLERCTDWYERQQGRPFWGVVCRNTKNLGGTCGVEMRAAASELAAVARWNMRDGKSDG